MDYLHFNQCSTQYMRRVYSDLCWYNKCMLQSNVKKRYKNILVCIVMHVPVRGFHW